MTGIDPVLVEARPVLRHADNRGRERLFVGTIDEFDLVIVELTDRCFAVEDRCPHRSARFSKLGRLVDFEAGTLLECGKHGFAYSLVDGGCLKTRLHASPQSPSALEIYAATRQGNSFLIEPDGRLARHLERGPFSPANPSHRHTSSMTSPSPDPVADLCPLCGEDVEGLPLDQVPLEIWTLYPIDALNSVPNARTFRCGNTVLLHHACSSAVADTDTSYWDSQSAWWACAEPERPLDNNTHFDLSCMACARRWSGEGSQLR